MYYYSLKYREILTDNIFESFSISVVSGVMLLQDKIKYHWKVKGGFNSNIPRLQMTYFDNVG